MSPCVSPWQQPWLYRLRGVLSLALLFTPQRASAASASLPYSAELRSVAISSPSCGPDIFPLSAFVDALRVELAGRGLACCTMTEADDGVLRPASVRVTVDLVPCVAEWDVVRIGVKDSDGSQTTRRDISLSDVADEARPRALALAVAELIRAMGQEQPATVKPSPKPPPPPTQPILAPPLVPLVAFTLHLEAEGRGVPMRDTMLWGGRLGVTAHRRILHADLDVGGAYSRVGSDLGDVLIGTATVGVGCGPRWQSRGAIIDLGLRAELGWAWIRGRTALPEVHTGSGAALISSVGLRAALEAPTQSTLRPRLALEGGGVLRGLTAQVDGRTAAGFDGYYLLFAIGAAFSP
jgi:hypothetical protein